jgi:ABC-type amino acid transport substrate-binding protein/mono/diheme cytochrome c family protein
MSSRPAATVVAALLRHLFRHQPPATMNRKIIPSPARRMRRIGFLPALALAAAVLPTQAAEPTTLRICADPDNLPFSSNQQGQPKGMYVELAEAVAKKLEMQPEFVWWYTTNQRRALRNTIQKNECDVTFALPADSDWRARGVQKSAPFLDVGYAAVAAPGTAITSLASLRDKRIAVQFSTTPHILFSQVDGFKTTTYKTADEVFDALAKGDADVGLLWGPVAGWDNKGKHQGRWQITPLAGTPVKDITLGGQVVVGVRAGAEGLKARIDGALGELAPQIRTLAQKYGFPTDRAVSFDATKPNSAMAVAPRQASASVPPTGWVTVQADKKPEKKATPGKPAAAAATATAATAAAPADPLAAAGKVRFNDQCSHCHGADGASPVRERDVRRLSMRYDADKWREVATTTIKNGRSDLGMPPWKDSLSEDNIKELLAFLASIQK